MFTPKFKKGIPEYSLRGTYKNTNINLIYMLVQYFSMMAKRSTEIYTFKYTCILYMCVAGH